MELGKLVSRLNGAKYSGSGYVARCPAHDDNHQSLSIAEGDDGRILLNCHADCSVESIVAAMGLKMSDLFPAKTNERSSNKTGIECIYDYHSADGELLYQKIRRADKSFTQRRPDGKGDWIWNRKGISPTLYNLPAVIAADTVYIAEGEKDADTLCSLGYVGTSGEDGAGRTKWKNEYTEALRGKTMYVLFDNDAPGHEHGIRTAEALCGVAKSVKLLDLLKAFPHLPEKGDISEVRKAAGDDVTRKGLEALVADTPEYQLQSNDGFLSCFKTLDEFTEEEATWLIPGWIPEGQLTLMAADGGIGKTTVWCNILTALSSGTRCILDPAGHTRKSMKVAFLTTEDSVRKKLKQKLRLAGANEKNILTPDFLADKAGLLRNLKFGSSDMAKFIRHFKPALCVFDPVQGFVPPDINMGSRNAMRDCMAPLITLGEECGTTFLVVCHTNKRKGAYGRDRIADSADLWDISRSVLMAGYTEDQGVRFLSNEKNNYSQLQESLLFSINDDGQVQHEGTTWKRDREYAQDAIVAKSAPRRNDCKEFVLNTLAEAGDALPTKELEDRVKELGYSFSTVKRAKDELKRSGDIEYFHTGSNSERIWHTRRVYRSGFEEISDDEPTPWDNVK